jgi:hypothetical protein
MKWVEPNNDFLWSLIRVQLGLGCVFSVVQVSQGQIMPESPILKKHLALVSKE